MGGVYGEFLAYFSELMERFKVVKQNARLDSGYDLGTFRYVQGIRQNEGSYFVDKANRKNYTADIGNRYTLWTYEPIDAATEFVEIDGGMYRPMNQAAFNREGGFYEMAVERLVGSDGTKNESLELTDGAW